MSELSINQALSQARAKIGTIAFDKSNGFLKAQYTSMNAIAPVVNEVCAEFGLATSIEITQTADPKWVSVLGKIRYSAEVIDFQFPLFIDLGNDNKISATQKMGAILTYARRYAYQMMFNLSFADDEDIDDNKHTNEEIAKNRKLPSANATQGGTVRPQQANAVHNGSTPAVAYIAPTVYGELKAFVLANAQPPVTEQDWGLLLKSKYKLQSPNQMTTVIADDILKSANLTEEWAKRGVKFND